MDVSSLTKLFARLPEVIFTKEGVMFQEYPFYPSRIYPSDLLIIEDIAEIDENALPPQIRTIHGEILFVPGNQKNELVKFAKRNKLPLIHRFDVWDLLLEPFLDTEFEAEQKERTLRILEQNGINREECETIREEVSEVMILYNFATGLWDWVHLGLEDLLSAQRGSMTESDFHKFYWYAMKIALRAKEFDKRALT